MSHRPVAPVTGLALALLASKVVDIGHPREVPGF
jgi:hypothetical protein